MIGSQFSALTDLLVTGADGLVGRRLLEMWRAECNLLALVHRQPERPIEGISYIVMDLATPLDAARLPAQVDAVIHLAQSSQMRAFPENALDIYAVNTASTAHLLDWAVKARVSHFIFASTGGIYAPSPKPVSEEAPIDPPRGPLHYYFDTKLCSERLVRAYSAQMHTTILRPFFVYGPQQRETMLIPRLIGDIREGRAVKVKNGEGTRLNPIFVADAVNAIATCLVDDAPRLLNLAGPEVLTIRDIALRIGAVVRQEPLFDNVEGEADAIVADISRLKKRLIAPMKSFKDGIARMEGMDER